METLLPGISAEQVPAGRLTVAMLSVPERAGPASAPVLFAHGNVSSSLLTTARGLVKSAANRGRKSVRFRD